ncbi:MAG: hypothetical protein P1V35_05760 [Planctomycetota bacterium]|nr:hypothetical protein [Planctomycetota bacterium]
MKALPLILACLGSGFAGAATLNLLNPSEAQAEGDSSELIATLRGEFAALQDQSAAERKSLEDRLIRMEEEALLVSPVQERSFVPDRLDANISDGNLPVSASTEAIRIGNSVIPPEDFEAWVARASESIAARKQAERDQERAIRDGERTEEQIAKLTTELGLDQRQQSEFRRHLEDNSTKRADLFKAMRDGSMDRGDMRESMGQLREAADQDLRAFLTEDQVTTYKDSGLDRGFGGRGNRGGGGGGNNAGGGNNRNGGNNAGGGGGRRGN